MITKQTHMVNFNSFTIQTSATIIAGCIVVWCVFLGSQSQDPFPSNTLKISEVQNFPLDFLGQLRNIPRAEFSTAETPPYRTPQPPSRTARSPGDGFANIIAGGSSRSLNFFLLRTTLKDRPQGPPPANHQLSPTANRHQPTTANRRQPPIANHQPPIFAEEQVP